MHKRKILIVDDEKTNLEIMRRFLNTGPNADHEIMMAYHGAQAWEILNKYPDDIDVILLDKMMPVMSGVEFMDRLNKDEKLKNIPVIMQTSSDEKEAVREGFSLGVYHYLVKPYTANVLNPIVNSAIASYTTQRDLSKQLNNAQTLFNYVNHAVFKIKNLDDVNVMSVGLARLFPDPEKVALGISEILANAVEHGNLGISYDEKSLLNAECKWKDEIEKRLKLDEYKDKEVTITYFKNSNEVVLNVKDQGKGFDYQKYLDFDPERGTDNHGRGIAFANKFSFDTVEYKGCGNEVNCAIRLQ